MNGATLGWLGGLIAGLVALASFYVARRKDHSDAKSHDRDSGLKQIEIALSSLEEATNRANTEVDRANAEITALRAQADSNERRLLLQGAKIRQLETENRGLLAENAKLRRRLDRYEGRSNG